MKKLKASALLLLCAVLAISATGCAPGTQEVYPEKSAEVVRQSGLGQTAEPTDAPAPAPAANTSSAALDYDPAAEEDTGDWGVFTAGTYNEYGVSVYAGTTPIPLDPVDMPTPTPRPELTFTYAAYTASGLGLTFEGPVDWELTEDTSTTFTLTDLTTRDSVNAFISVSTAPVANNYKAADAAGDLKSYLLNIQKNYTKWRTENAAKRTLMGADGYYNIYRGELYDGTIVRGLVHIALVNGRTVTVHLQSPGWFSTSYTKVYTKLRNTLKAL